MSARDGRDGATRGISCRHACEHYSFTVGVNNSTLLRQYPPAIAHYLNIDLERCSPHSSRLRPLHLSHDRIATKWHPNLSVLKTNLDRTPRVTHQWKAACCSPTNRSEC